VALRQMIISEQLIPRKQTIYPHYESSSIMNYYLLIVLKCFFILLRNPFAIAQKGFVMQQWDADCCAVCYAAIRRSKGSTSVFLTIENY